MRIASHLAFCSHLSILVLASSLLAQGSAADPRTAFCQKQFDYFVTEITKLQTNYAIFADLKKDKAIVRILDKDGMWYACRFFTNCSGPAKTQMFSKPPYLGLDFSIGWRSPGQMAHMAADPMSLELSIKHKTLRIPDDRLQHWTRSGILIFGGVRTDNEALKKEVGSIFEKIVAEIMKWEEEKKKD